jgi:dihydrolipoamide dehydrogenase
MQALLESSHMYYHAKNHFAAHGVMADNVTLDLGKMMAQKAKSVEGLTKGIEGLFKKNKVRLSLPIRHMQAPFSVLSGAHHKGSTRKLQSVLVLLTHREKIQVSDVHVQCISIGRQRPSFALRDCVMLCRHS